MHTITVSVTVSLIKIQLLMIVKRIRENKSQKGNTFLGVWPVSGW